MISIRSTKELKFDLVSRKKGYIRVEIESYSRNATLGTWTLNIKDTLIMPKEHSYQVIHDAEYDADYNLIKSSWVETITETYYHYEDKYRTRVYKDDELNQLIVTMANGNLAEISIDAIDTVFSQGLLFITQKECLEGVGIYNSDSPTDWEIFQPEYNEMGEIIENLPGEEVVSPTDPTEDGEEGEEPQP